MSALTETHGVHPSSHHLNALLWQRHQRRLFSLIDVFTMAQLPHVPLTQNKNLARLLAKTPVGNWRNANI